MIRPSLYGDGLLGLGVALPSTRRNDIMTHLIQLTTVTFMSEVRSEYLNL